jgi:steroid delta-isomerase-like uncharacterized protein
MRRPPRLLKNGCRPGDSNRTKQKIRRKTMQEENKQVVLSCWGVANSHDASGFERYYAEDVVYHGNDGEIRGRENVTAYLQTFMTALPDIKLTVEDIFGEGDRVFSRARLQGTNTGEFNGMPPTGKSIDIRWIMNACRVQDGRIVEEWETVDQMEILRQLGLVDAKALSPAN